MFAEPCRIFGLAKLAETHTYLPARISVELCIECLLDIFHNACVGTLCAMMKDVVQVWWKRISCSLCAYIFVHRAAGGSLGNEFIYCLA